MSEVELKSRALLADEQHQAIRNDEAQRVSPSPSSDKQSRFVVSYSSTVREVTDEAQGLSVGPIRLDKNQWFYLSALLFALPFLYGTVYQMVVPSTPSTAFFDGCSVEENLNATLCPPTSSLCYAAGEVLSFSECIDCNGGATNLVDLTSQQQGILFVRVLAAFGTLLGWMLLFSLRVRYCRYGRRSLALLAYGVYTAPPPVSKSKQQMGLLVVAVILLVALYVQAQIIRGATLQGVMIGSSRGAPNNDQAFLGRTCYMYNVVGEVAGEYAVHANFNSSNPSTAAFGSLTPTWRELCTMVAAAVGLYAPILYAVFSQYLNPYSSIGLTDIVADGGKGVSKIISETIKYEIEMLALSEGVLKFMRESKLQVQLTWLQALVRLAKSTERPAEEFMCELWGDDPDTVAAVLAVCADHVVLRDSGARAPGASPGTADGGTPVNLKQLTAGL